MKLLAAITAVLMMLGVPQAVRAADPATPALLTPSNGATVDQPLFTWQAVADIAGYEVEVAVDEQFVTMTDRAFVLGTAYVPSRTYQAKTHYWRVRVVYVDGARDEWSETRTFTRRWTSEAEPTGTEIVSQSPARVENLRIIDGVGGTLTSSTIGFQWDPVPGASFYEVHLSNDPTFSGLLTECFTPHTTLTPYLVGEYVRRTPLQECIAASAGGVGQSATWQRSGDLLTVQGSGVDVGQELLVSYPPSTTLQRVTVVATNTDQSSFTIADTGAPADPSGELLWQPAPSISTDQTLYVRVRAVDYATEYDYPYPPEYKWVVSLWSEQRKDPSEPSPPGPLEVDIVATSTGGGDMMMPATPQEQQYSGTDLPVLRWDRVQDAQYYRVVIALDQDFTTQVGEYYSPSEVFTPLETYDDVAPSQRYYWYALPCDGSTCAPDREAILDSDYVGTFAKRSEPLQNLAAQPRTEDGETTALLRWGDALTAARTVDATGTSGGSTSYDVEITKSTWAKATTYQTDNLAVSTGQIPSAPGPGDYKWRVRPRDGQDIPLAWAEGPRFTLKGLSTTPDPSPTPTPTSTSTTPPNPNPNPTSSYDQEGSGETSTKPAPPTRPGKPDVSKVTKRKVLVRWRRSSERGTAVTAYLVYRSTNGKSFKKVARTTSRKTRISVKRGRTYWFRVVADSAAGTSNPSKKTRFRVR